MADSKEGLGNVRERDGRYFCVFGDPNLTLAADCEPDTQLPGGTVRFIIGPQDSTFPQSHPRLSPQSLFMKTSQNSHSRIRSDHATELAEDYVEVIAETIEATGMCRAVNLAEHFGVSHVTVNRTIGRLKRDGYVTTEPYAPIHLTAKGKRVAKRSKERHAIVYAFLKSLGVSDATAATDSEGIEHHVSAATLDAMKRHLKKSKD